VADIHKRLKAICRDFAVNGEMWGAGWN